MKSSLLVFVLGLCALQAYGLAASAGELRRMLEGLQIMEEEEQARRGIVDCKPEGDGCTGIIRCCGTLQCYWEKGYSAIKKGSCVTCVTKGQKCQRDSQCCGSDPKTGQALQCNKGNRFWVDGNCEPYRSSGECYRDGQCNYGCDKSWWQTHGTCRSEPEE